MIIIIMKKGIVVGEVINMANLETKYKNYMIIHQYNFNSLDDFLNELITKKINKEIFLNPSSVSTDYNFTKTNSFEEAWNLCKYTYDDGYKNFSNLVKHIQFKFENNSKLINTYKPVGTSASVPRFLYGIPDNMHAKKEVYNKPVINIYYQSSYSYRMNDRMIRTRGILTLALINYLENIKNYSVIFNFVTVCKKNNELVYIRINLKNKDEKLKMKHAYFPIVHPSFLRRLEFRALEIIPNLVNDWNRGYGIPLKYEEIKSFIEEDNLEKNIYISTPEELGIYGENIEDDANRFINRINSKYSFLNEEENVKTYRR